MIIQSISIQSRKPKGMASVVKFFQTLKATWNQPGMSWDSCILFYKSQEKPQKTWLVHRCVGLPRFRRAKFHKFHLKYLQGERNQDLLLSWLSRQKHKSLVRWIDLLCNCSMHFKMLFLCWSSLAGQMISFFYAAVIYFLRQCQHLMKFTKRKIMMASFY